MLRDTIEDVLGTEPIDEGPVDVYFESSQAMAEIRLSIDPDYEGPESLLS